MLTRDERGKAVRGKVEVVNQAGADYNNSLYTKYNSFAAIRTQYKTSDWKKQGTAKTNDSMELRILFKNHKISNRKAVNEDNPSVNSPEILNMKEVVYIDTTTELPVKIELYKEVNGNISLFDTKIYEFKNVEIDGSLFDTSGIDLEELPSFIYDENAAG